MLRLIVVGVVIVTWCGCAVGFDGLRWVMAMQTSRLHPTSNHTMCMCCWAVQGVAEGQQASQLAEAALLELKQLRQGPASPEDAAHDEGSACATVASVDALLRCSLRGQQPWPNAVLSVSRALLQQQSQWAEQGYRSSAGGSPVKAHAVLLLFNSQLAALAGMREGQTATLACSVLTGLKSAWLQQDMSWPLCMLHCNTRGWMLLVGSRSLTSCSLKADRLRRTTPTPVVKFSSQLLLVTMWWYR